MAYTTYIIKDIHILNLQVFRNLSFTKVIVLKDNEETLHNLTDETVTFKMKKFADSDDIIFTKELDINADPTTGEFTLHLEDEETTWNADNYEYAIIVSDDTDSYQWISGTLEVATVVGS